MYSPWQASSGTLVNPGISLSGEASFSSLMDSEEPLFGPSFYRYAVFNDSFWDWRQMSPSVAQTADCINPGGMNAYDPAGMRLFQESGGKVLQYHGYADPLIPSLNAPAFYDLVHGYYSDNKITERVEDFYRLFMVPGMGHCNGGVGAWVLDGAGQGGVVPAEVDKEHSMLWSLVEWVEGTGSAPEKVVGTKFASDTVGLGVDFTRPMCRWPVVARYDGKGDVDDAGSWECSVEGIY